MYDTAIIAIQNQETKMSAAAESMTLYIDRLGLSPKENSDRRIVATRVAEMPGAGTYIYDAPDHVEICGQFFDGDKWEDATRTRGYYQRDGIIGKRWESFMHAWKVRRIQNELINFIPTTDTEQKQTTFDKQTGSARSIAFGALLLATSTVLGLNGVEAGSRIVSAEPNMQSNSNSAYDNPFSKLGALIGFFAPTGIVLLATREERGETIDRPQ